MNNIQKEKETKNHKLDEILAKGITLTLTATIIYYVAYGIKLWNTLAQP